MNRRLFLFFIVLFCAVAALLLLSALVQAPSADIVAAEEELPVAHQITAFVSMPPVPTSASLLSANVWLRVAALFAAAILILPYLNCICDANGRVLCKRRYVRSYHLVFKPELACG